MQVLVPVQHPLTERNLRAIRHALDLVATAENPELIVFHVNEFLDGDNVDRQQLRTAVEDEFDRINASYIVRDGMEADLTVLDEVIRIGATHLVVSQERRNRWQRLTDRLLEADVDLLAALRNRANVEVIVIDDV